MLPRSNWVKVGSPNPAQLWRCRWAVEDSCLARDRFFLLIKLGRGILCLDHSRSSVTASWVRKEQGGHACTSTS
jgi:hypothetical protein